MTEHRQVDPAILAKVPDSFLMFITYSGDIEMTIEKFVECYEKALAYEMMKCFDDAIEETRIQLKKQFGLTNE